LQQIEALLPKGEILIPYGYASYQEYDLKIDEYVSKYGLTDNNLNEIGRMLCSYKDLVHRMNIKENWSVVKYMGETMPGLFLTKGKYYYWPCSEERPVYEGVIDDEEFTSYLYPTGSALWEIAEDPLGMAGRTLLCIQRGGSLLNIWRHK
jgi:hypothetical protein